MSDETPPVPAARLQPSASYSFTMRLHLPQQGGAFARVAQAIADADAMLGAIDLVRVESRRGRARRDGRVRDSGARRGGRARRPRRSTASTSTASPTARS